MSSRSIEVALIEDNRLVREGIILLLNRIPDIRAVAAESNGKAPDLRTGGPDVILLDLGLENGDSLSVAQGVKRDFPNTRVIVMDLLPAPEDIEDFIAAGVAGFILKDASLDEVARTIRSVAAGQEVLPARGARQLFSELVREALPQGEVAARVAVSMTPRERDVIALISEGLSNKAMGERLEISVHTVKSHLRNIMEKLALHSRLQLAAYAHDRTAEIETDPTTHETDLHDME